MLYEFLTSNRGELIARCREKVAARFQPTELPAAIDHGVPLFLQQLADILHVEQLTPERSEAGTEAAPSRTPIGRAAALHGADLLRRGFTVDQVVHAYGDVCQSITDMAVEQKKAFSSDEFRTLNRCLDDAIADAVTSYGSARQIGLNQQAELLHESLNSFSDQQRQLISTAIQAYNAIKTGNIGLTGATGALLIHALESLQALAERTVPEIRLSSALTTLPPA